MNKNVCIFDTTENCIASFWWFQKMQIFLLKNNYNIFSNNKENYESSYYFLINTCPWNRITKKYFIELLDYLKWRKKPFEVIFYWCFKLLNNEKFFLFKHYFISTRSIPEIDNIFEHKISYKSINSIDIYKYKSLLLTRNYWKRYLIEVVSGCNRNCSFCWVKKNIWDIKSKKLESILEDVKYAINNWYWEIVLLWEDVAGYWLDIGLSLDILINDICSLWDNFTIYIRQWEPWNLLNTYKKIWNNFKRISRIAIPIQSFSNRILNLMKRAYNIENVLVMLKYIKKTNDFINIENNIILGYPTETFEEFVYNIKESSKYYTDSVFNIYEYIEWTKKYNNTDLINKEEMNKRIQLINKLEIKHPDISISWSSSYYPWTHSS